MFGWLVEPQGEYFFVIGSRRLLIKKKAREKRKEKRDFLVSAILLIKLKEIVTNNCENK